MPTTASDVWKSVQSIREQKPLVHNITNYVVMNNTANALLAIGASPVMAHAIEEVEDMTKICSSLVINVGTLSAAWVDSMEKAMKAAKHLNKPCVLDPVGNGATPYRSQSINRLLQANPPTVIRGNANEIAALIEKDTTTKGVDATQSSDSTLPLARRVSEQYNSVVVVSGETDYIVAPDGRVGKISNGHILQTRVTGMGCTHTAIIGAFLAVEKDPFVAAVQGTAVTGIIGELAAQNSKGPGSMQSEFLDLLYNVTFEDIASRLKISEE
eukprot:NODE_5115_length_1065_cov_31.538217_g4559_i0.p1 GENE.NODE_5115_length_1065_cov_31.538217_g4559_i0~~NODE_5115_length_1065_cov_31.538217_g4559_i0.p1  ORF type:complete len:270 (+),score=59.87 NODE_5115_length_1065_cov_31.538217_g4559_i0:53-862(+)